MKLRHLSRLILEVGFDKLDWDLGRAREAIDLMKSAPKGSKTYNPKDKVWRLKKELFGPELLGQIYDLQDKDYSLVDGFTDEENFDAEKWLDDTFGPKEPAPKKPDEEEEFYI